MKYIVLDLEWNGSPKGKSKENKKIPFEIIEIGAIKLDENLQIIDQFCEVIKPVVYKEINHIIKKITSFSNLELNEGNSFNEVIARFINWCGEDYRFCTWGSMDLYELQRNMAFHKVKNTLEKPLFYYDIQKMYSIEFDDGKSRGALKDVTESLLIKGEIEFHRALSDAFYTAEVIKKIDFERLKERYSIDYYRRPRTKEEEVIAVFDNYSKFLSREYNTKNEAMSDVSLSSTKCPKCGKKAAKKIKWFSDNSKMYYSLSYCALHGYIKGKIRMKKTENEKVYAIKILKLTDNDGADFIRNKQEEIRIKRNKAKKGAAK